jgi:hypothetical protein
MSKLVDDSNLLMISFSSLRATIEGPHVSGSKLAGLTAKWSKHI